MPDYISPEGFDVFITLTLQAAGRRILAPHVKDEHIRNLKTMVEPGSYQEESLNYYYRGPSADYLDEQFPQEIKDTESWGAGAGGLTTFAEEIWGSSNKRTATPGSKNTDISILRMVVGPNSGFEHTWIFHASDTDPRPSVPHGHIEQLKNGKCSKDGRKLDPWRNYIYLNGERTKDREDRDAIVALWNNKKFRELARGILKLHYYNDAHRESFLGSLNERKIVHSEALLLPGERKKKRQKIIAGLRKKPRRY